MRCCDDSPNRHASTHARESGHVLIESFEPGEDWINCFADGVTLTVPAAGQQPELRPT